jgi:hypothetical protein
MSEDLNLERRIYDLYSFDVPYDLEPANPGRGPQDYTETVTPDNHSKSVSRDEADDIEALDLTFEEDEPESHFPWIGFGLSPGQEQISDSHAKPQAVLGTTLSQRKQLLKEHISELRADIRRRERLQERLLEKTGLQTTDMEHLLGTVKSFSLGSYPSVDMRRTHLERQITALENRSLDEQIRCWKDLVALKKELREVLEEYHLILSAEGL